MTLHEADITNNPEKEGKASKHLLFCDAIRNMFTECVVCADMAATTCLYFQRIRKGGRREGEVGETDLESQSMSSTALGDEGAFSPVVTEEA